MVVVNALEVFVTTAALEVVVTAAALEVVVATVVAAADVVVVVHGDCPYPPQVAAAELDVVAMVVHGIWP